MPVDDRTTLFSDNGSGHVSRLFGEYLQLVDITDVHVASYRSQRYSEPVEGTNGKLKRDVNQLPYDVRRELEVVI